MEMHVKGIFPGGFHLHLWLIAKGYNLDLSLSVYKQTENVFTITHLQLKSIKQWLGGYKYKCEAHIFVCGYVDYWVEMYIFCFSQCYEVV